MSRIIQHWFAVRCQVVNCPRAMFQTILALLFGSVLFVAYQTIRTHEPPLIATGPEAWASQAGDMLMVEYERDIEITRDFTGAVTRTIVCENGWSHDVPATIRKFSFGKYHAARSFLMPYSVPGATKCKMHTVVSWQPPFSLSEHSFSIASIDFVAFPHDKQARDFTQRKGLTKPDEMYKQGMQGM